MLATATAQNGHTRHHLTRRTHRARGSRQQPSNLRVVALAAALVVITGWSGAQGAERAAELDSLDRRWIQEELATKGFDPGPADGQFGPKTRRAIKAWQEAKGQAATGELTKEQSETLLYRDRRTVRTWPNGDRYEGDFDGKRTGRGVLIWGDRSLGGRPLQGRLRQWPANRSRGLHLDGWEALRRRFPRRKKDWPRDPDLGEGSLGGRPLQGRLR